MNLVLQAINALGSSMFANNALLGGEVRIRVWILLMANLDITLTPMLQKANKTYQKKLTKKDKTLHSTFMCLSRALDWRSINACK